MYIRLLRHHDSPSGPVGWYRYLHKVKVTTVDCIHSALHMPMLATAAGLFRIAFNVPLPPYHVLSC